MVKVKKQKGGLDFPDPNYDKGGTSIGDLPENIFGTINYTIGSMISGIDAIGTVINLPSDMGTAFTAKNAPNPDNVHVGKI